MKFRKDWLPLILVLTGCGVVFYAGWLTHVFVEKPTPPSPIRDSSEHYKFINPLLLFIVPEESSEYSDLKKHINSHAVLAQKENRATSVSVYFNDLNSSAWTGINQDALYTPASTLKVAIMIGYLKRIGNDPSILYKKIKYTATKNPGQYFPPPRPLATGYHTVGELIDTMITQSDNDALNALYNNDPQSYTEVFKNLDLPVPTASSTEFLSPRLYSRIFRSLYNATYTSRDLSEQALQLLSYTTFTQGLVAGVPKDVTVSHKFGEHTSADALGVAQARELHDCGIVYYPHKPYFLCVMTKGTDFEKLSSVIADISTTVYEYVNTH